MYHQSYRDVTPLRLSLMRGLTVLTFLFVALNVSGWNRLGSDRPVLPAESVQAANNALDAMMVKAKAAGERYTFDFGAADFDQLSALSYALQDYRGGSEGVNDGPPEMVVLTRKMNYVRDALGSLAMYNGRVPERGSMVETYYSSHAVQKYRQTHGAAGRPTFLPPPPAGQGINWRQVAKRGIDGWLLAMIPAFLTILVSFRLRRESLWAELVERPWMPVTATAFWLVGLWGYVGQPGIIERRLQGLIHDYREEHHAQPSEEWIAAQRLVLMRRARDVQHALAQIAEAPELIRINSRRAIFASWLIAMLSGPFNMMLGVVQAYANVARVNGGVDSSLVDTTKTVRRRSSFSGFTDGYLELSSNGERIEPSLGLMRGKLAQGDRSIFLRFDCRTGKPAEAYAASRYGSVKVMAGMVTPWTVFDYPPPFRALFRSSPGFDLLPSFSDFGLQAESRAGPTTMQFGLLTGDGTNGSADDRTDAILRLFGSRGPLSASASYQGGDEHDYVASNVSLANKTGSVAYQFARRDDRNPKLDGRLHQLEMTGQRGPWRVGLQAAHAKQRTLLGVIERALGGANRLMVECLLTKDGAPAWTLRFQQGLVLATP